MNAVEIEEAVSALALAPFDRAEFPFAFLAAFGNKETTIQRLRSGNTNQSDIPGGVLQRNHIHLATCDTGKVNDTLSALRASPKNGKGKPKFVFVTDGTDLEAEELATGEVIACKLPDLANHFGFFLPLAGISTVAEIKNNPIDIKATSRLNKLYVELLKENPDWGTAGRRQELNQFMARLIFCFFAEDTGIFNHQGMFTACIKQMTEADFSITHEVISELFRVMDTKPEDRAAKRVPAWAKEFPYVNGGLFTHKVDSPRFSKIARSYLTRSGELDWKQINPDIFGSMIQAVADDDERGELGMHYTSVPNILKVLDPLFLDDLREELEKAEDNPRKLLNLRKRIANIRVFDPACGSGNFLVIAYIKMREIEAEIVKRRGERGDMFAQKSWIKLTNFYGIEIKSFAAEVARLSLLIAEFQSNVRLIGQREACLDVLPLHDTGKIVTGNALRLDWLEVCPPPEKASLVEEDLAGPTGRLALDAHQPKAETYICGNPPYYGGKLQTESQKADLDEAFKGVQVNWKSLDYVAGWFMKASMYLETSIGACAFVSTNSICQGQQVPVLWPEILGRGLAIAFAHTSFRWSNLATHNAVVVVVIVGLSRSEKGLRKRLISTAPDGSVVSRDVSSINPYLVAGPIVIVEPSSSPLNGLPSMVFGNMPRDAGHLLLSPDDREELCSQNARAEQFVYSFRGSEDFIHDSRRYCLWIEDKLKDDAASIPAIRERLDRTAEARRGMKAASTQKFANRPHRFVQIQGVARCHSIIVPRHTSERREYLPVGLLDSRSIVADSALAIYDAPIWALAIIASRLHLVWIAAVCGKIKTDFRYSNTIGWNTFPVPTLTQQNKADLTRSAEEILIEREHNFPSTIADLYEPEAMPKSLRAAHASNDDVMERIYIGRRFRNDTERLEKLFGLYAARHSETRSTIGGKAK